MYKTSDLNSCRDLWIELTEHHRQIYNSSGIGGDNPGLFFDKHLEKVGAERIWVVEDEGQVIGMAALVLNDDEVEIEPFVVRSEWRGKGIGQKLMETLVSEARRLGVRYICVRPVARNREAADFFFESGFDILGHIQMLMDLSSDGADKWEEGPTLFNRSFRV